MKQKVRKVLAVSGMAIVIGASGFSYTSAKTNLNDNNIERTHTLKSKKQLSKKATEHKRTLPGVVTATSGNTLTITSGGKTFTINTTDTTNILNLKRTKISFNDINVGDKVRSFGTLTNTTMTAITIRDISIR